MSVESVDVLERRVYDRKSFTHRGKRFTHRDKAFTHRGIHFTSKLLTEVNFIQPRGNRLGPTNQ